MKKYVIVVAGGKGLRMGSDLPKQFIPVEGKPVLMHTLEAFYQWDEYVDIVLVLPEEHREYWHMLCKEIGCKTSHHIVNGGDTRFQSVKNGLNFLSEELGVQPDCKEKALIGVHDGVRPFPAPEVITNCFDNAEQEGSAVPVIPIVDSMREKNEEGTHSVDRNQFYIVQTPQVFRSDLLLQAYRQPCSSDFTDDATVVEASGHSIFIVPGNRENIKITTPFDLLMAKALYPYCRKE
ncbi:2-C-methyl-D-erythritol 4-phosphate cytidylyltransferase [Parabacteroides sp. PF5-9]|uniref:2-C-methyl-D-erythritol 4-phosphate cytidylyltransferase n=1 Tax=Parabacteroides sp. PF5-9 TaxID=1742404 RepID=UPI002475C9B2|nr:2-C-methyl-D-erythritol 4-phosphate cytidylyltransferase [Parabacteroides sp. PF5-9]MDH6356744.1 2-C-methyl-D-erythritol 4-phosphate cytidylyltransferase [Parabacteroides sp. PF5-9]